MRLFSTRSTVPRCTPSAPMTSICSLTRLISFIAVPCLLLEGPMHLAGFGSIAPTFPNGFGGPHWEGPGEGFRDHRKPARFGAASGLPSWQATRTAFLAGDTYCASQSGPCPSVLSELSLESVDFAPSRQFGPSRNKRAG